MKTLFIDACPRVDSRTRELAWEVLACLPEERKTVELFAEAMPLLNAQTLQQRDQCVKRGDYSGPLFQYARDFAQADQIVIAAPYWDLLFPAVLRSYLELVCVNGLVFCYTPEGYPKGLCKAKRLIYVTTAGGPIEDRNFGFSYVKALADTFFGIPETLCFAADGLDIMGADVAQLLREAKAQIRTALQ